MAGSPDFGVDFEPLVFPGSVANDEPEAQSRVIDGVPTAARVDRVLTSTQPRVERHAAALTAAELKRQLRARLRVVNAEIKRRARLEAERDELNRLLAAANAKPAKPSPRADVRPIRHVAG